MIQRKHADQIPAAYRLYRKRTRSSRPDETEALAFRKRYAVADRTQIEFVGIWDTVGALGIPLPFWGTLGEREFLFHDTQPSSIVQHARHAVSIDENRKDFQPTLWDDKPGLDLLQVWFAGVHSDVGGGYDERGLSYCACDWIVREAVRFGLQFEPHLLQAVKPNPKDRLHNERKGIYLMRENFTRTITGPVHSSVRKRWDADADGYQRRSKAMQQLLDSVDHDWSRIPIIP
jgi:hypothetical protein